MRIAPATLLLGACTPEPKDSEQVSAALDNGEQVLCEDPSARLEQAFEALRPGDDWSQQGGERNGEGQITGGGLIAADLNGDGRPDLYLPQYGADELYLSRGDTWELAPLPEGTRALGVGGAAADYDDDGDLDLFITNLHGPNLLLLNDGAGGLDDVSEQVGLDAQDWDSTSATWADLDGDGDLDLFVGNHLEGRQLLEGMLEGQQAPAHPNQLFENLGDGQLVDRSDRLPLESREGYTFLGAAEDFTGDGQLDLYMVNDFGPQARVNELLVREGDAWHRADDQLGLDVMVYGMGLGLGDLNGDARPELLITSWGEQLLLESSPDGQWFQAQAALGLDLEEEQQVGWGAELADLDNDGRQDALMGFGPLLMPEEAAEQLGDGLGLSNPDAQPDAVFLQQPDGEFLASGQALGVDDEGITRGFAAVDLNGDGWLDLVKRFQDGPALARLARCGEASWLQVQLVAPAPNVWGVGAQVRVLADGRWQSRGVRAGGSNHGAGNGLVLHFGLGEAEEIDALEVVWPDGERSEFTQVDARQTVTVRRTAPQGSAR